MDEKKRTNMRSKSNVGLLANFKKNFYEFIRKEKYVPYVFNILMTLIIMTLFIYPLFYAITNSFIVEGKFSINNYEKLILDTLFLKSMLITFLYVIIYTVGIMFIGFITALAIDTSEKAKLPGTKLLSSLLTLPYAIPDVVGSILWMWMLNPQKGVINYLSSFIISWSVRYKLAYKY